MQFPVPQFTEVEDKIIGPLTIKQFGIIFGASVVVFLGYSVSGKNLTVLIALGLLFGIPALGLAFGKFNGRPVYNSFGKIFEFILSEKSLIFHKQIRDISSSSSLRNAEISKETEPLKPQNLGDPKVRLKEVRELLQKRGEEEKELVGRLR